MLRHVDGMPVRPEGCLVVQYGATSGCAASSVRRCGAFNDDVHQEAYRIAYCYMGATFAIPFPFRQKVDALRAIDVIKDMVDWSGPPQLVAERCEQLGMGVLRAAIGGAQRW